MANHDPNSSPTDDVLEAVTEAMFGLHERYYGRKPNSARTLMMGEDLLACMLGDVYTDIEKTMIELQRQALVNKTRSVFQQAMEDGFIAQVERLTRRHVVRNSSRPITSDPTSSSSCSSSNRRPLWIETLASMEPSGVHPRGGQCGGGPPGGGGGIVVISGAVSGQISSTRQGAWSTTKRAVGRGCAARAARGRRRGRGRGCPCFGGGHDFAFDPSAALECGGRPSRVCASASSSSAAWSEIARRGGAGGRGAAGPAALGGPRMRWFRGRCWRRAAA